MTTRLYVDQVQSIYAEQVDAGPLIHFDKLDGAVNAPFQYVFDTELYPTVVQKAVKLIDGISRAQAYQDGNKRLAWLSGVTLLELNGLFVVEVPQDEAADFVLDLRGDEAGLAAAALWMNDQTASQQ